MADSAHKKDRPYISSRFVLELDDKGRDTPFAGTLQSIEGGSFKSDVVEEKVGSQAIVMKYSGRPKFEEVTIQVGMSMVPRFWDWISESFTYKAKRHTGALVALDYDNKERWRRNFRGALIKEVTFPALDGAAKDPAYLTVKFAVEDLQEDTSKKNKPYEALQKHDAEREMQGEWNKQLLWLPSMFTFRVDGLTKDSSETCKIESFTVKQEIIDVPVGGRLVNQKEPGRVDFPNLAVTILQRDSDRWMTWWDEFVRKGDHEQSKQRNGHISYLQRTSQGAGVLSGPPLLTIELFGIGILGVSPVKHESKQVQLQKVKLDMYVESMDLKPGAGTINS